MAARFSFALLGAESTGKTELAHALARSLHASGLTALVVPEVLREWCAREGRTPRADEQLAIAQEQTLRVTQADGVDVVIADTTPVMTAVYSDLLFQDRSLYAMALHYHRLYDATLLTGLDLPWIPDGLQRDGQHVREPVDALVRRALHEGGISYKTVYGSGEERLHNALRCIGGTLGMPADVQSASRARPWQWPCDKCSDPECEHRLFTGLIRSKAVGRPAP
jgi:nicotinamide riboside kinase